MARIVISGVLEFPPEVREEALTTAKPHIEGAYTEKGCVHYIWTADLNHPGRVAVYEEWESPEDLEAHLRDHWYDDMREHLGKFKLIGAETNKYRVELKEPVYGADFIASAYFSDETKPA